MGKVARKHKIQEENIFDHQPEKLSNSTHCICMLITMHVSVLNTVSLYQTYIFSLVEFSVDE